MVKKFNSMKNLTKAVTISIIIIIIYSISEFISGIFGLHHEVLTGCIFAFFGTELAACGFIKIFKIKEDTKC
jgi:hypothetical protein